MVLTNAQIDLFFTNADQIALCPAPALKLADEGILGPADLLELDKKSMMQISDNLRRPGGRVVDPSNLTATIPTPPYVFGAKSQQRLNVACSVVQYYSMIGRILTAPNLKWDPVLFNFKDIWESIENRRELDNPDTPKISKTLSIMK